MEFKFRVWDKIIKKMYYPFTGVADDLYLSLEGRICSEDEEVQEDGSRLVYRGYRMIPLLCTGLMDKNGKEIYQSDILRLNDDVIGEVVFQNAQFLIKCKLITLGLSNSNFHYDVIGNIFEKPELLITDGDIDQAINETRKYNKHNSFFKGYISKNKYFNID